MDSYSIHELIGDTDIYLIDQILKGRYQQKELILDAGCGEGRNMHWFLLNHHCIYGIDNNYNHIAGLKLEHPELPPIRLQVADINSMPFGDNFFHHIISSAVLHFANSTSHFYGMIKEMCRVLKPNGSLFIRMTTNIGIEDKVKHLGHGVYELPDNTTRFLLTRDMLKELLTNFPLVLSEPFKNVNVSDQRCMCTLLLQKHAAKS